MGFALVTLYGINGWFGWFQRNGHEVVFAEAEVVPEVVQRAEGRAGREEAQLDQDPERAFLLVQPIPKAAPAGDPADDEPHDDRDREASLEALKSQ